MFNSLLILTKRSLRKSKMLLVAILGLGLLSAALLTAGAVVAGQFPAAFETQAERLATEDLQYSTFDPKQAERLAQLLAADDRVQTTTLQPVLAEHGSFDYAGNDLSLSILYLDADYAGKLGRLRIIESGPAVENPVYLPLLYRNGSSYALGDSFAVHQSDGQERNFQVAGFYEGPFLGSVSMGVAGLLLPHDSFEQLANTADAPVSTGLVRAKMRELSDLDAVNTETVTLAAPTAGERRGITTNTITVVRAEALNGSLIYSAFLNGFAGVIAVVIMLFTGFLVRTSIRRELPAIGAQLAIGFTWRGIMTTLVVGPVLAALLGVGLGTALAYQLLPLLAAALSGQSGLPWQPVFSSPALLLATSLICGGVLLASVIAAVVVARVAPVVALQGGAKPHSFNPNPVRLDRTRAPLNLLLGVGQGIFNRGQSLAVLLVLCLVSFVAVFATVMGTGVLGNKAAMRHLTVGESEDVSVSVADGVDRESFRRQVSGLPGAGRTAYIDWLITDVAGSNTVCAVTEDFSIYPENSIYQGREPLHSNEVAVSGKLARQLGRTVGQQIAISASGSTKQFLITGLLSTVQYAGMRIDLTTAGYRELEPNFEPTDLAFFLTDRSTAGAKEFVAELKATQSEQVTAVRNTRANVDSALDSYVGLARNLAAGILILAALVSCLVIGLLVQAMIVRSRASFGIRMALGFTSGELVRQTLWAYLPSVGLGVAAGAATSYLLTPTLVTALVSGLGVMQLNVPMPAVQVLGICVGVILLTGLMIVLTSLPIRRILPTESFGEV